MGCIGAVVAIILALLSVIIIKKLKEQKAKQKKQTKIELQKVSRGDSGKSEITSQLKPVRMTPLKIEPEIE